MGYLLKEYLEEVILKREKKISEYRLVLLIDSLTSALYELNKNENYETLSEFDRVYVITDLDVEIVRIA
ncbi:hypothetical protein [Myroides odoratimimus]|uniref:hypothetical protein n=1 Tax=Myroides odoratimimus TaxID=76832 RepID=UPI0009216C44|nr:hypothetical protein [Myroides odoratimimus]SHM20073.1 hypothetical protein SAMN05444275_11030 [Myroides odoratimimus subsp. xuanwuensis]